MARFLNRYAICAVAATILISAWLLTRPFPDLLPSDELQVATFDQRLVVFGDSWSDNQSQPPGKVWTDWLCSMLSCHQENLAQTAKPVLGTHVGAVVDNKELDLLGRLSRSRLADFKSQLQQWWDAESRVLKDLSPEEIHSRVNRTVFVVSFGVWDIWSLITTDYESASESVERRIATLVGLLDTLSERVGALNLLVTQTVDVTFLPGFGSVGDQYKDTVRILDRWNERLREVTRDWDRGTVYLFDTNTFVMDRIRDWQLYAAGIEEENGLGKNLDRWENVVEPCVESRVMMSKQTQCAHPDRYLFWDEMHLGPAAHRLMATEVYQLAFKEPRHTRGFAA